MSLVRFQNISKRFDGRQVLREVFFRLENGDRVGLIGKNGSGKTTALKMSAASSIEKPRWQSLCHRGTGHLSE